MIRWAKAPDFADQPERRAEVQAQTVVDKQRYLDDGMTPLKCQTCASEVLVRKYSAHQTSVQWTGDPAARCPVFAKLGPTQSHPHRPESCADLERTIQWAVDEGVVEIPK
ncbi:hypothetical protein [Nocardia sp. NPDC048505]|uniref:hypothetical protein n=1 Tax=unclassified Nocardia TaxID=2637762 RepID=UPI0033DECAE7